MTRLFALITLVALTAPASAHFVWLAPHGGDHVRMVFSEDPTPDDNVPIAKIAQAKVHIRTDGKPAPAEKTVGPDHYLIAMPRQGPAEVGAVCEYGVLAKSGDPFLLVYYAKTLVAGAEPKGLDHPLEIYPVKGKAGAFEVRWQGKPLVGAEVVFTIAGVESKQKADSVGRVALAPIPTSGLIALRAKHVEARTGERAGKSFKEVRHYATLTLSVGAGGTMK